MNHTTTSTPRLKALLGDLRNQRRQREAKAVEAELASRVGKTRRIEEDTALLPDSTALVVVAVAANDRGQPFTDGERRRLRALLVEKAQARYAEDRRWAKKIRARGNEGSDVLTSAMARWLREELNLTDVA